MIKLREECLVFQQPARSLRLDFFSVQFGGLRVSVVLLTKKWSTTENTETIDVAQRRLVTRCTIAAIAEHCTVIEPKVELLY